MNALDTLSLEYPELCCSISTIADAFRIIKTSFERGGKLLVCGNGGSSADSEHIVGELMKSFKRRRPSPIALVEAMSDMWGEEGAAICQGLYGALPAISLSAHTALGTAFANDGDSVLVFAQQVYGYGRPGDVLMAITTSGSSPNVIKAAMTAKAIGMPVIGLTGQGQGELDRVCDAVIRVPRRETYRVQELHLPVYHCLCAMLEEAFFDS